MPEEKPSKLGNLTVRLLTAAVMVPVLIGLLFFAPKWGFLILAYVATVIAGQELMAMAMPGSRVQQVIGIAATVGVMSFVRFVDDPRAWATMVVGLVTLGLLAGLIKPDPVESAGARMAWLIAGPLYAGGLIGTIARLHALENGGSWVVLAMMLA